MYGIGVPELLIVLVIVLLIFGPKRLPSLGRQLGAGMREFKDSVTGKTRPDDDDDDGDQAESRRLRAGDAEDAGEPVEGEVVRGRRA